MTHLEAMVQWLESFAPLAALAPQGVFTAPAPAAYGAALADAGQAGAEEEISGRRTVAHRYLLWLHCATMTEQDRLAPAALGEALAALCRGTEQGGALPQLPAPCTAQRVVWEGMQCTAADDSGLGVWRAGLRLEYVQERND